jgi:hypothetical protein
MRQIEQNSTYLVWGGINFPAIKLFVSKFGISTTLGVASLCGLMGLHFFVKNIKRLTMDNGHEIVVDKIQNKNAESLGYIATYLLPFVFQTYSSWVDIAQLFLLLFVMYIIYTHSTLIIVNPILNIWYSLYDIEYHNIKSHDVKRNGIFIVNFHNLEKDDCLSVKRLKSNLFYGILSEDRK